jgi:predicted O-methyltransferase YrrM
MKLDGQSKNEPAHTIPRSHLTAREFFQRLRANPSWILSEARSRLMAYRDMLSSGEFSEIYRQVRPFTMLSNPRLRALHEAVHQVVERKIPGDIVECGTARGGSAALMALTLKRLGSDKVLWVFDTFEGIPAPTQADPDFEIARPYTGSLRGDLAEVTNFFERLGVRNSSHFVKGLFQETLPQQDVGQIAVLHIDGDWYESVKTCLDNLFDQVSRGGVIQIDDYGHWEGARKAVDEFLEQRKIPDKLAVIDYTGRRLVKS